MTSTNGDSGARGDSGDSGVSGGNGDTVVSHVTRLSRRPSCPAESTYTIHSWILNTIRR
jgi:hypothetical protein